MRRFVLVALLSICAFSAFAATRDERPNTNNRNEYEVSQILVGNNCVMENPYQTVISSSDDIFNFVTADGVVTKIIVDNETEMATVFSDGEVSHVKAKITRGKNGKVVLAYGGFEIYLNQKARN